MGQKAIGISTFSKFVKKKEKKKFSFCSIFEESFCTFPYDRTNVSGNGKKQPKTIQARNYPAQHKEFRVSWVEKNVFWEKEQAIAKIMIGNYG